MPRLDSGWLGVFDDPERATCAAIALREAGYRNVRATLPAPDGHLLDAIHPRPSRIGWLTLVAALTGTTCGYALTGWTSASWPLLVGGKPIVSWIPFTVIAFESTILIGGLTTFFGLLVLMARARHAHPAPREARFSKDQIAIFVGDDVAGPAQDCSEILRAAGAGEVRRASA